MAKGLYFGVNGVARKCKKMYFGVDGKARKVKKIYIGVGGKARLCFSGELALLPSGSVAGFSMVSYGHCSVFNGVYGIFYGGHRGDNGYATRRGEYYSTNLTRGYITVPTVRYSSGTRLGQYAMFAGGMDDSSSWPEVTYAHTINQSLVLDSMPDLSSNRFDIGATSTSNYSIFSGGGNTGTASGSYYRDVDAYNISLVKTTKTASFGHRGGYGMTVGGYGLVAGVNTYLSNYNYISHNNSLVSTQGVMSDVPTHIQTPAGAGTVGNYGVYVYSNKTVAFNTSMVQQVLQPLAIPRNRGGFIVLDGKLLIAGGIKSNSLSYHETYSEVESYDSNLVRDFEVSLPLKTGGMPDGVTIGNYGIIAGGYKFNNDGTAIGRTADVEVFVS